MEKNDIVFWFDTSVIFKNNSETLKNIVETLNTKYSACGFRILSRTWHTIVAATDPTMYDYFPIDDEILHLNMIAATVYIVSRTQESIAVLENVIRCAFIERCMGPPTSTIHCIDGELQKGGFAGCHRYDQSALALSLAQCSLNVNDYRGVSDLVFLKRIENYDSEDWIDVKKRFPWIKTKN
ncbi:hypothetical protein FO519_009272 [Halicephalobus sp. NKZ332]|nr:hypothetical protein FO519_009272 [Halicephalobus sp. NKZ332]